MLFGHLWKSDRGLVVTVGASALLSAFCIQASAGDQDMAVLAHASSGPLQCEIRKNGTGNPVELTGFIVSSRAAAGNFRFTVTKSGRSGSSNIHQGNTFDLAADKEGRVGQVTINLEHDAHAVIELFVRSDDGLECVAKAALTP